MKAKLDILGFAGSQWMLPRAVVSKIAVRQFACQIIIKKLNNGECVSEDQLE